LWTDAECRQVALLHGSTTLSRRPATLELARPPSSVEPVHLLVDSTGLCLDPDGIEYEVVSYLNAA
jgi:hypothetical protein